MAKYGGKCWTEIKLTPEQQKEYYRKNLLTWKKGTSGNPKGRPKGTSIAGKLIRFGALPASQKMKDTLLEHYPELPSVIELTLDDVIWLNLMIKATNSNINLIDFISEKVEKQQIGFKSSIDNSVDNLDDQRKELIRKTIRQLRANSNEKE